MLSVERIRNLAHQKMPPTQKTLFGKLFAFAIGFIIFAITAEILTRSIMPHWKDFHSGNFITSTSVPGHADVPIGVPRFNDYFAQNNGDFRVRITINDFGLRNPEPITEADNRAWIFGDSMTFGWGVEQQQMYSSLVTNFSGVQTYNIASPGTNVCGYRALLDRMPENLNPTAIVVGLVLENDVLRYNCASMARKSKDNTTFFQPITFIKFKRFISSHFALYNFISVSLKRIPSIERVLIKIGLITEPHLDSQNNLESQLDFRIAITVKELVNLKSQLPEDTPVAILIIPARFEIKDSSIYHKKLREKIITSLNKLNITTIDPIEGFLKKGFAATHFPHDGHWNALGHKIAATAVSKWLSALNKNNFAIK